MRLSFIVNSARIQKVQDELARARDMLEKTTLEKRDRSTIHYWDGKIEGLSYALKTLCDEV